MTTLVFEDVPLRDGVMATVAVRTWSDEKPFVMAFMAVDQDGERFCTDRSRGTFASLRHDDIVAEIDDWVESVESIEELHAENLKRVRGMRALHEAVATAPPDCTNESSLDADWRDQ